MTQRDYYEILGVNRNASPDELKAAFRRLARQYHPDVNDSADAEERFKELNEAYAVLSDADRRAAYDRFGHAGVKGAGGADFTVDFSDFADVFSDLFGWRFWPHQPAGGEAPERERPGGSGALAPRR